MSQSSVIGAALLVAYVVFVIYKGELPCWFQVLGIATSAQCSTPLTQSQCGASGTSASTTPSGASALLPSRSGGGGGVLGTIGTIAGGVLGGAAGRLGLP